MKFSFQSLKVFVEGFRVILGFEEQKNNEARASLLSDYNILKRFRGSEGHTGSQAGVSGQSSAYILMAFGMTETVTSFLAPPYSPSRVQSMSLSDMKVTSPVRKIFI